MSNTLITKKLGSHVASQLIESISEPANNVYYLTASRHTQSNTATVPIPYDTISNTEVGYYQELIFGKKITSNDVSHMIPRVNWTINTAYSMYSDSDNDLFTKDFYVASDRGSTYYVYKVLDNNSNTKSIVDPGSTSTSETACNFITTADGYTWKLMYSLPEEQFEKFATADFMPVVKNSNVAASAVPGAIDVVEVTYPGSNYAATLSGAFTAVDVRDSIVVEGVSGNSTTYRLTANASSNNDFYTGSGIYLTGGTGQGQLRKILSYTAATRIITVDTSFSDPPSADTEYLIAPYLVLTGDGDGEVKGYASVTSNATVNNYITKINIVERGSGFTYASAQVSGNTGGISNNAVLRVVIPPKGGHGSDPVNELGSNYLGVSVNFSNNESGTISTDNDFAQIGILKDPLFGNVHITMADDIGTFAAGETVYQVEYSTLTGTVTSNAQSNIITGTDTEFADALKPGSKVILLDSINNVRFLHTVDAVTNSTSIQLSSNAAFDVSGGGRLAVASLLCSGTKVGNASPYITLSNTEPKFVVGKRIIGAASGAWANVSSISINERSYSNWSTFDGRTRIQYTNVSNTFVEDDVVFQQDITLANAYYHSANTNFVFLTSEKGPINPDPTTPLERQSGGASFTLGSTKYSPDVQKGSGELLYIENTDTISRSDSQTETIRIVLKF